MTKVFQIVDGVVDVSVRVCTVVEVGQGSNIRHLAEHLRHLWRIRMEIVIW